MNVTLDGIISYIKDGDRKTKLVGQINGVKIHPGNYYVILKVLKNKNASDDILISNNETEKNNEITISFLDRKKY